MQKGSFTSSHDLGMKKVITIPIEPKCSRRDRKVLVRPTINALKRVREDEPIMCKALAGPDNEERKAGINLTIKTLQKLKCSDVFE